MLAVLLPLGLGDKLTDSMFVLPIFPILFSHRAKFRASTQLATSLNAAALSQILGISLSQSQSQSAIAFLSEVPSQDQTQSVLDTPADSPSPAPTPPNHTIPPNSALQCPDNQIRTSTTSVADYFAAKMRARQHVAVTTLPTIRPAPIPIPTPTPESDSEAQDVLEGTTPIDGIVVAKDKTRKRKRKDAVEVAEKHGDCTELHAESKKGKKKQRKTE